MNFNNEDYIFPIQKKTAQYSLYLLIAAIAYNLISYKMYNYTAFDLFFNIGVLSFFSILFLITYFVNKPICRIIHIIIFSGAGLLTILSSTTNINVFIGLACLFVAFILNYSYGIIRRYSWKINIILLLIIVVAAYFKDQTFIRDTSMAFILPIIISICIVAYISFIGINLVKKEISYLINFVQKNEVSSKLTVNMSVFLSRMALLNCYAGLQATHHLIERGNMELALKTAYISVDYFRQRLDEINLITACMEDNEVDKVKPVYIHKLLSGISILCESERQPIYTIQFVKNFCAGDIYITAIPYQIFYILNNLMDYMFKIMLSEMSFESDNPNKTITLTTILYPDKTVEIIISGNITTPVITSQANRINIKNLKLDKGDDKIYSFSYIKDYVTENNGKIEARQDEQGLLFILKFKNCMIKE